MRQRARSPVLLRSRAWAVTGLLSWGLASSALAAPVVTVSDGEPVLLRDAQRLALAAGAALRDQDIVELGAKDRFVRVEIDAAPRFSLGPSTRVQWSPKLSADRARPVLYLLQGWIKVDEATSVKLGLPGADLVVGPGGAVVHVDEQGQVSVFAEAGPATIKPVGTPAKPTVTLKSGEFLRTTASAAKPAALPRPDAAFLQALPQPFLDTLPALAGRLKGAVPTLKSLGPLTYADARPWLQAEPTLRRPSMPRWQPLLRESAFRQGLIADLKLHPEWQPILFPPEPTASSVPGAAPAPSWAK